MSNTAQHTDPLIADMIASGLMKAGDTAMVEVPEEILVAEDPATEQEPVVTGGAMIERLETSAPVEPAIEAPEGENVLAATVGDELDLDGIEDILASDVLTQDDVHPSILEGIEHDLAAQAAREEIYAEQDSRVGMVEKLPETTPAAPVVARAPRAAGSTLPKREARFAPGNAGAYVAGVLGDAEVAAIVDGLPKKVKEKAANLVDFLNKGRPLSVFTRVAVDLLKTEGKLSGERLVKAFTTEATKRGMSSGYSIGTARSQAGQQVALMQRLGITVAKDGAMVPNVESSLWQKLAV